ERHPKPAAGARRAEQHHAVPADGEDGDQQELDDEDQQACRRQIALGAGQLHVLGVGLGGKLPHQRQEPVDHEHAQDEEAEGEEQPDAQKVVALPVDQAAGLGDELRNDKLGAHVAPDLAAPDLATSDPATSDPATPAWAAAISALMHRAAAAGSGAALIGRPITRKSAPSRAASPGVITRFWSPSSAAAGRIPGTTSLKSGPQSRLSWAISRGEQTMPSQPWACARAARRRTWSPAGGSRPTA